MSHKRDRMFSGILTNLDHTTDAGTKARLESEERQTNFINSAYKKAEDDEKAGTVTPNVVYSGLQETHHYTADPLFDKSREAIAGLRSLPIKQYEVTPEGDFAIVLDEDSAALHELLRGEFCHNCHDRQPDSILMWNHIADRLKSHLAEAPPEDFKFGVMCCYCGARLKIENEYTPDTSGLVTSVTPEQRELLGKMFGPLGVDEGQGAQPRLPAPLLSGVPA